ncbi:HEAT repeat domain-containing protein [Kitasatospora sp. NPDC004240]
MTERETPVRAEIRRTTDPDPAVRRRAAEALPALLDAPDHPDRPGEFAPPPPEVVRTLIRLTRDPDAEVREGAAFSLGTQLYADTPALRDALHALLTDEHPGPRTEGARGLAQRRDPRALAPIAALLADEEGAEVLTFAAAAVLGAPELLPLLEQYDEDDPGVADALAACDPRRRDGRDAFGWAVLTALHGRLPDTDAALTASRLTPDLELTLTAGTERFTWDVAALGRAHGADPERAASAVAGAAVNAAGPTVLAD